MLRPCNLACRWRVASRSVAWPGVGGRLSCSWGISDATRGTLEVPDQQARALGRLLGVLIDDFCRHSLESTWFRLGRLGAVDARLGLSVDESRDWGELGVVGVVDGIDSMLFFQLVDGQRRASRCREDAPGAWRLGGIHEKTEKERKRATDRIWHFRFPWNRLRKKDSNHCMRVNEQRLNLPYPANKQLSVFGIFRSWLR